MIYTHIADNDAPFNTKMANGGVRDSTYLLDGLLYHESDLRIEGHYSDTAGFTDHVFALMRMPGFRFGPRIWICVPPSCTFPEQLENARV